MDIHFCDLCNESVPQTDLDKGLAWRRGNRVVCNACERAMSDGARGPLPAGAQAGVGGGSGVALAVAEPASATFQLGPSAGQSQAAAFRAAPAGQGSGGAWMLGLVALLFSAGATAMVLERVDEARADLQAEQRALTEAQGGLGGDLDALDQRLTERLAMGQAQLVEQQHQELGGIATSLAQLQGDLRGYEQRLADLQADLAVLRQSQESGVKRSDERFDELGRRLGDDSEQLSFHTDRLIELEERVRALVQGGLVSAPVAGPAGGGEQAGWKAYLADLSNAQASVRLDALYALEKTKDLGVVPYVVPMLKDVDLFVRMAAARVLEDLSARSAVPALIDALEDTEPVVTESAMFALQKITGQDFGFEPNAAPAERAKKVKVWRDWWKKEGDAFLAAEAKQ